MSTHGQQPDAAPERETSQEEEGLLSRPLRVTSIVVRGGNVETSQTLVKRELDDLTEATTVGEVVKAADKALKNLDALGIYDAVQIVLDEGKEGGDTCTTQVLLKEKRMFDLKGTTSVESNEGKVEGTLHLVNPLGRGDRWQLGVSWGNQSSYEYAATLSRGRLWGKPYEGQVTVHQQLLSFLLPSSFVETVRGAGVTLSTQDGRHAIGYDLSWRCLKDPSLKASPSVETQIGNKLKSAVRYTFQTRTLDNRLFPTQGWSFRSNTEVAGVGLDANLLRSARQEVGGQWVTRLWGDAVLLVQAQAGLLLPWGPSWSHRQTYIADRFFLGGVGGGLRGFVYKGAGPAELRKPPPKDLSHAGDRADRPEIDALGGDLYTSVLASLRHKITHPAAQALGLYAHVFVNGGSIVGLTGQGRTVRSCLTDIASSWRWSTGVGLVWPTVFGNVEVNYSQVLSAKDMDRVKPGLQLGFNISPF